MLNNELIEKLSKLPQDIPVGTWIYNVFTKPQWTFQEADTVRYDQLFKCILIYKEPVK